MTKTVDLEDLFAETLQLIRDGNLVLARKHTKRISSACNTDPEQTWADISRGVNDADFADGLLDDLRIMGQMRLMKPRVLNFAIPEQDKVAADDPANIRGLFDGP